MYNYTFSDVFWGILCCSSPIFILVTIIIAIVLLVSLKKDNRNISKTSSPLPKTPPTTKQQPTNQQPIKYYVKPNTKQFINNTYSALPQQPNNTKVVTSTQTIPEVSDVDNKDEYIPYTKRRLLTKHELEFYKELKRVADSKNLCVLSKIRMADLVSINTNDYRDKYVFFNKVSRKHVDFALAEPNNLNIVLLIELDDASHDYEQVERDKFVQSVYKKTGYKLLRTRDSVALDKKITALLNYNPKH